MGITENHAMELLSRAYVQAIAGYARLNIQWLQEFDYGVDGTFRPIKSRQGELLDNGFPLDFQLKSTTNWRVENNHVIYNMDATSYNKIVDGNNPPAMPQILILLCLPKSPVEWVENNEEQLLLRKCCYWDRLAGESTDNKSSVTIQIPRTQLLNSVTLLDLLKKSSVMGGNAKNTVSHSGPGANFHPQVHCLSDPPRMVSRGSPQYENHTFPWATG